jgi:ATP-binding cassette subfamily B protein
MRAPKAANNSIVRDPWVLEHLSPYRRYLGQIVLVTSATIIINFSIPLLNRAIVNDGILTGDSFFIGVIIAAQALLYAFLIVLNLLRTSMSSHISHRLLAGMADEYARHIVHLPMAFFQTAKSGEIVERMRDLERVERFASLELLEAVAAAISITALGLMLCWIDVAIFLAFVGSAASYLLWVIVIGRRRREIDAARFEEAARSREIEIGIVEAIQDIKIAAHEERSLVAWAAVQRASLLSQLKAASVENLQAAGGQFCNRTGMLLITFLTARKAVAGSITLGDFMITLTISLQLYFYVNQLLAFVNRLDDVRAALGRAREVRSKELEDCVGAAAGAFPQAWQTMTFRQVAFCYPGSARPSLVDVSFEVLPGSMTALVGPSGSGKSSILKLLLKLYEPTSGAVLFGGNSLRDIGHAIWRERVGAVMQEGALFAASIRDNIVANRDIDEEWLQDVVEAARLTDFVSKLGRGLDTLVGPAAEPLSSGQVQRILIARALYKKPDLLLLDEATSALDGRNESSIIANVAALLPNVTSVVAAHRLHTLAGADQVIVLDGGHLLQRGEAELLSISRESRFGLSTHS